MGMNSQDNSAQVELLSAYLDDELDARERAEVEALVARDTEAAALLEQLHGIQLALRDGPAIQAPAGFAEDVMAAAERQILLGEVEEPMRPRLHWTAWSAAAVIVLMIGVAGTVIVSQRDGTMELELAQAPATPAPATLEMRAARKSDVPAHTDEVSLAEGDAAPNARTDLGKSMNEPVAMVGGELPPGLDVQALNTDAATVNGSAAVSKPAMDLASPVFRPNGETHAALLETSIVTDEDHAIAPHTLMQLTLTFDGPSEVAGFVKRWVGQRSPKDAMALRGLMSSAVDDQQYILSATPRDIAELLEDYAGQESAVDPEAVELRVGDQKITGLALTQSIMERPAMLLDFKRTETAPEAADWAAYYGALATDDTDEGVGDQMADGASRQPAANAPADLDALSGHIVRLADSKKKESAGAGRRARPQRQNVTLDRVTLILRIVQPRTPTAIESGPTPAPVRPKTPQQPPIPRIGHRRG